MENLGDGCEQTSQLRYALLNVNDVAGVSANLPFVRPHGSFRGNDHCRNHGVTHGKSFHQLRIFCFLFCCAFTGDLSLQSDVDPCSWYLIAFTIDTTLGVAVSLVFLKLGTYQSMPISQKYTHTRLPYSLVIHIANVYRNGEIADSGSTTTTAFSNAA